MKALDRRVVTAPVEDAVTWLDLVPVDVDTDEIDAERLQPVEALLEGPRPEAQPRVVLDAIADRR
jgi:hypothetical protein